MLLNNGRRGKNEERSKIKSMYHFGKYGNFGVRDSNFRQQWPKYAVSKLCKLVCSYISKCILLYGYADAYTYNTRAKIFSIL